MNGRHGHITPNDNGFKANCGGPAKCRECQREAAVKLGWVDPATHSALEIELAAAKADGERDYLDMRRFQRLFIQADHKRRDLEELLAIDKVRYLGPADAVGGYQPATQAGVPNPPPRKP